MIVVNLRHISGSRTEPNSIKCWHGLQSMCLCWHWQFCVVHMTTWGLFIGSVCNTTTNPHNPYWVAARCATEAFRTTCAVYIEDCEGWWLSGCCGSVAEHWPLMAEHWLLMAEHWPLMAEHWLLMAEHWPLMAEHWLLMAEHWPLMAEHWLLMAEHWPLMAEHWLLMAEHWPLMAEHWLLMAEHWPLMAEHWLLMPEHWLLMAEHWPLMAEHWLLMAEHWPLMAEHWLLMPELSWVWLSAAASLLTFLYFRLTTSLVSSVG